MLSRTSPRQVLLVRDRGVGEHLVLFDFATRCAHGAYNRLKDKRIFEVDCRRAFPSSPTPLIDALFEGVAMQGDIILAIEGFASLVKCRGDRREQLAGVFAFAARAQCRVIGILTPQEFEELFAGEGDTDDVFEVIQLHEPEQAVTQRVLECVSKGMQIQYDVAIEATAIQRAVALADTYILHERLPQKAIKVLRALCEDMDFARSQGEKISNSISEQKVTEKVAEMTGIPFHTLAGFGDQIDYVASLSELVVGQDHAVREVANELALIKVGMVEASKPASVMLFVGQTGTGKTELAKTLASIYSSSRRLKTFTLGNFSEAHSVSGLIGVPAGYVGHDQGGRLVNDLNSDPYGVFLLDEADKAHPDVMQPFLNLFDEGWLYDQRGVKASASHAIFILTTNVAQRQIAEMFRQGKARDEILSTVKELLSRTRHGKSNRPVFTAEFLARIKRIVLFNPLDLDAMRSISRLLCRRIAGLGGEATKATRDP